MTLGRARQLLAVQAGFGEPYNANSTKLIRSEVMRERGQPAADQLIVELKPDAVFGFRPGAIFRDGWALDA